MEHRERPRIVQNEDLDRNRELNRLENSVELWQLAEKYSAAVTSIGQKTSGIDLNTETAALEEAVVGLRNAALKMGGVSRSEWSRFVDNEGPAGVRNRIEELRKV